MSRYRVTVDGRTYDVEIDDPRARPVVARVLGEVFRVEVDSAAPKPGNPETRPDSPSLQPPSQAAAGHQQLTAPIPGTIAKLMTTVGQAVQRGDALVTIEAMKMFNVIRSPWSGTVTAVHVADGQHVAQGELMVSLQST